MSAISSASLKPSAVRARLVDLGEAQSFAAAEIALDALAAEIDMPLMAWAPDVGKPHFDAHMDAFMRRHGWSEEVLSLWWDRHVMLKMPLYIRCRFEHLPFVSPITSDRAGATVEERSISADMLSRGMRTMLTVPVVLPRGRIAMVTWIGSQDARTVQATSRKVRPEILAAGHFFMEAFDRQYGPVVVGTEEASRLTPQEWECLRLLAQGYRDSEIARLKKLAPTTIRFHLENVTRKLGASNRTHAVAIAAQLGILGPIGG